MAEGVARLSGQCHCVRYSRNVIPSPLLCVSVCLSGALASPAQCAVHKSCALPSRAVLSALLCSESAAYPHETIRTKPVVNRLSTHCKSALQVLCTGSAVALALHLHCIGLHRMYRCMRGEAAALCGGGDARRRASASASAARSVFESPTATSRAVTAAVVVVTAVVVVVTAVVAAYTRV